MIKRYLIWLNNIIASAPEDISMDKLPTEFFLSILTRVNLIVPKDKHVKVVI